MNAKTTANADLGGGDVRAERNRYTPIVTQDELVRALEWNWVGLIGMIESGAIELSQGEYRRIIDAVQRIATTRQAVERS